METSFSLSVGHLAAHARWSDADAKLRGRTGKGFAAWSEELGAAGVDTFVVREHSDLAEAFAVYPCACEGCGRAGARYFMGRWWAIHHFERRPVLIRGLGLGYEVTLGPELYALEDARGRVISAHYNHTWTRATA